MKAMTLEESKKIQIEILRDLNDFCRKNGIKYSLAYGSLIGAVRHKGFIPWDDDIDVTMLREDFEKFLKVYKSDKFELLQPMRAKRWEFFARIVDPNTEVQFDKFPESPFGVWLTIFPIDNRPDDEKEWLSMKRKVDFYAALARLRFGTLTRCGWRNVMKKVTHFIFKPIPITWINGKILEIMNEMSTKKTSKKIVWVEFNRYETYPSDILDDCIDMPFEDINASVMTGYDTYLRTAYGEYMKLPPIEEQQPSHDYIAYYIDK